jgi:16S rRNA (guanine527-N7)-methyltransferase
MVSSREFRARLDRRARRAGISVNQDLAEQLETYYRLLVVWNERINLSGFPLGEVTPEAVDRVLVEPLVAATHVRAGMARIVDVGSGGGTPALPLALSLPGTHLLMVEAKTRKAVFLREAIRAVGRPDTEVMTARFEELLARPELHEAHDLLTVRAVRIEPRVLMGLQAFVRPGGQLFLFRAGLGGSDGLPVAPPLAWHATYPLVESLRSRLVVMEKRGIPLEA